MKVIGLTGPSGSGKTRALEYLKQKGVKTIEADRIYHDLLKNSEPMRSAIKERFGTLDTKELGKLVFADKQAMRDLESITHPFVIDIVRAQTDDFIRERAEAVVIEAIALFESELAKMCDCVILVTAAADTLTGRITARDGVSREYAEARLKNRTFNGDAAIIIRNDGDLNELYSSIDKIYAEVIS